MGGGCLEIAITTEGFGPEKIVLMPERCAFWPARRTLLVADLHLGKCETFRAFGAPLPTAVNREMLDRLTCASAQRGAERILVLGDLLHAPAGLTPALLDEVAEWRRSTDVEFSVVPGNHDRHLAKVTDPWNIRIMDPGTSEGPFAFHHFPVETDRFLWCGHQHPAKIFRRGSESIKLPGFIIGSKIGILPAFTRFAAGGGTCSTGRFYPVIDDCVSPPLEPLGR